MLRLRNNISRKEHEHAIRLQQLAAASLTINSILPTEQMLHSIASKAREIIGAHQATITMINEQEWEQTTTATSFSEKYTEWNNYVAELDGSGIYSWICRINQPICMTQAELEAHPDWHSFGKEKEKHPPMRGWLAAPLTGRDGHNLGLIQLSDKYEGEFTEEDKAILVQM